MIGSITSIKTVATDFVPAGDRAYLGGFTIVSGTMRYPALDSIIKENGEWKFYGNQRDVAIFGPPPQR